MMVINVQLTFVDLLRGLIQPVDRWRAVMSVDQLSVRLSYSSHAAASKKRSNYFWINIYSTYPPGHNHLSFI